MDKIPGGLADKKKPADFDQVQLGRGIKVEMEHTSDPDLAREIAMDHLTEDPDYYIKLKSVEAFLSRRLRISGVSYRRVAGSPFVWKKWEPKKRDPLPKCPGCQKTMRRSSLPRENGVHHYSCANTKCRNRHNAVHGNGKTHYSKQR